MTRKDYIAIAKALDCAFETAITHPDTAATTSAAAVMGVQFAAMKIAAVMGAENPRFDRAKFLAACGVVS